MNKQTTFLGRTEIGIFAQGLFTSSLEKTAAQITNDWDTAEEIRRYIKTITAEDKKRYCYVLVNALGAGEFFGSNINADWRMRVRTTATKPSSRPTPIPTTPTRIPRRPLGSQLSPSLIRG
jgi:hypothetical protein